MEKINALPFKDHEGLLIEGPLIIQTKILKIQEGFFMKVGIIKILMKQ